MTGGLPADPDAIRSAVLACPHVARLSGDREPEVATYLPGRRVRGVAVRGDGAGEVEVHVVGRWGPTVPEIAAQVRAAVRRVAPRVSVTVVIADLDVGDDPDPGDDLGSGQG